MRLRLRVHRLECSWGGAQHPGRGCGTTASGQQRSCCTTRTRAAGNTRPSGIIGSSEAASPPLHEQV